jgi:hypothetical protein
VHIKAHQSALLLQVQAKQHVIAEQLASWQ